MARELERRWEESLRLQRQVEDEHERWQRSSPGRLSAEDERAIRSLACDLPAVWQAATTTPGGRQRIVRLLLSAVRVAVVKASERVDVELHWAGGPVRRHELARRVSRYERQADYPRLVERLAESCGQRLSSSAIAARLNAEGFRPPKRTEHFTGEMVLRSTGRLGLTRRARHGSRAGLGANAFRPAGLARRLSMSRDTVRRWLRAGRLDVRRDEDGHHIIRADADELARLRELHRLPRTWANRERLDVLKRPRRPGTR